MITITAIIINTTPMTSSSFRHLNELQRRKYCRKRLEHVGSPVQTKQMNESQSSDYDRQTLRNQIENVLTANS
ncbi:hypothetical protein DERP_007667 [Dermatophagoides pteronyssinus]|uniref:Uncharacterized protein n=1 Tax=Dermatophagoides pteronyssinus TaxID=6956 RepID=A0ABQ8JKJ2_DERPT|nr:hypothetical protein DERP_007667 [Dermatophagoides pteronyssinus]